MPDFDSMSPEEIMAWMETLAKRQGAHEGFTTDADMDIAEIDPSSVVIDEPGYVPYGQEAPRQSAPVTPPTPEREPEPEPAVDDPFAWLESLAAGQDDSIFNLDLSSLEAEVSAPPPPAAPAVNPMAWLEDIASSQGEFDAPPAAPQPRPASPSPREPVADPFASGVNPVEWLESVARRQGAKDEEFTTPAELDVPEADETRVERPGYTAFSFDMPQSARPAPPPPQPEPEPEPEADLKLDDPSAWLDSLASAEGYDQELIFGKPEAEAEQKSAEQSFGELPADLELTEEGIMNAIESGTVSRDQMQYWLDQQVDLLAQEAEQDDDEAYDPDAPAVPADLPDWLLEQVGTPPGEQPQPEDDTRPPLESLFGAPAEAAAPAEGLEMPDWLKEDLVDEESFEFENIFADSGDETAEPDADALPDVIEAPAPTDEEALPVFDLEIDENDPWVEAFDLEYEQGQPDIDAVPEWYAQNISDPERIAAVDQLEGAGAEAAAALEALQEAALPVETELPAGQPQAVPEWLGDEAEGTAEPLSQAAGMEIPEWLKEVESDVEPGYIPEWLVQSIPDEQVIEESAVSEAEAPVSEPDAEPIPEPMPVAAGSRLELARECRTNGDLEGCLNAYESLIRDSDSLEVVVDDLSHLVREHRRNPAVYRVLGDGLMRQGKLQAALDTYREALNQL
jgi:hypothetical protein